MKKNFPDYRMLPEYQVFVPAAKSLIKTGQCLYPLDDMDFINGLGSFILGAEEIASQAYDGPFPHPARQYCDENQQEGWIFYKSLGTPDQPDDAEIHLTMFIMKTLHVAHFYTCRMPMLAYYVNRRPVLFDLVKYYFGTSPLTVASLII